LALADRVGDRRGQEQAPGVGVVGTGGDGRRGSGLDDVASWAESKEFGAETIATARLRPPLADGWSSPPEHAHSESATKTATAPAQRRRHGGLISACVYVLG
jgi:hypothetical protein